MGKLIYISDDGTQEVSVKVDDYATSTYFVEEAVANLMYGMGYFPTNVMDVLHLDDSLEVLRDIYKENTDV